MVGTFGMKTLSWPKTLNYGRWYNGSQNHADSCCALDLTVTEFDSQGLELDYTLVGWGNDFIIENGIVCGYSYDKEKFVIDETLDQLERQLSSSDFFRANRQFIVSRNSIKEAQNYFNKGFSLKLNPSQNEIILISKAKVSLFKDWLGQ